MKTKTTAFLGGVLLLSLSLLVPVPLCDFLLSFFFNGSGPADSGAQMLAGIISETLRAGITLYLYSVSEGKGSSLRHGLRHGLLYSALIGNLYLVLGYFYFQVQSPLRFLVADGLILAIQGLSSGAVLYFLFRRKK